MSISQTDQRRRTSRRKVSAPSVIRVEFKDGMGNPRNITADLVDWSERGFKSHSSCANRAWNDYLPVRKARRRAFRHLVPSHHYLVY